MINKDLDKEVTAGIEDILLSKSVKQCAEEFINEDAESTRFLLIIGVNKSGSCFYRTAGNIGQLELDGLEYRIPEIVEAINIATFGGDKDA